MLQHLYRISIAVTALLVAACSLPPAGQPTARETTLDDPHSYANIAYVRVTHLDLDLMVSFEDEAIEGVATLEFEKKAPVNEIVLDTRGLTIEGVEVSADGTNYEEAPFKLGEADPILGAGLHIETAEGSGRVRVHYRTGPEATALQWLTPAQTSGKRHPFLFTQSQAIHARSWIPLQ
ncbi:MAG: aminopeptidase, partial [Thermoleophilia bacterium]|nr:aminopeptidase [Thermoleophilia bacterium]